MKINELFDQGKHWTWDLRGGEEAYAVFAVGNDEYLWFANRTAHSDQPYVWTLGFQKRGQRDREHAFGMSGSDSSTQVMSIVTDITRNFLRQYGDGVHALRFSSQGGSRTSLYAKMAQRLLPTWALSTSKNGIETDFVLTNPKTRTDLSEAAKFAGPYPSLATVSPMGEDFGIEPMPKDKEKQLHRDLNIAKGRKFNYDNGWGDDLDDVVDYTGGESQYINDFLHKHYRKQGSSDFDTNNMPAKIKAIDQALVNHKLPKTITVYTGIPESPAKAWQKYGADVAKPIRLHLPAYTSTTTKLKVALTHMQEKGLDDKVPRDRHPSRNQPKGKNYDIGIQVLMLELPAGMPAASVRKVSEYPGENEILLPRGLDIVIDPRPTITKGGDYVWHAKATSLSPVEIAVPKKTKTSMKESVDSTLDEMPMTHYGTMGDFNKPGPFRGVDKKLVPHPTNQLKAGQFFEKTPYDFRLFFSNIPGTGKYSETGVVDANTLQTMFKSDPNAVNTILQGSDDAITVVFVGNAGDRKVMMTPWIMAHRIGHAIQATNRRGGSSAYAWKEAEKHFFRSINALMREFYKHRIQSPEQQMDLNRNSQQAYAALFNAIGTQRSSRSGEIRRPYEFMYELFAQYLGTGRIELKPLPKSQGYGQKVFGRTVRSLNMVPPGEGDGIDQEAESKYSTEVLGRDMELMFNDVLSSLVGSILVM